MDKKEIKKILNNNSYLLVKLALDLVNLTEKERKVIELVDLKGYTQDQTAEFLKKSTKTIQRYRSKAYFKMGKCWHNEDIIKKILNT